MMAKFGVDPVVSLSLSLATAPGTYALLLGSGVSRAAGIPTGWDVTLDLVRKAAAAEGEDVAGDPLGWYRGRFGGDPVYSEVIDGLARSQAERRNLLKGYFEPTEAEREEGKKVPTAAHGAIARLVAAGYVSVILTTNFDRLTEQALEAEGITPAVIDTPDSVRGAQPLQHAGVTVVKVNGDYLDTRIKNTPEELEEYDPETNRLLDKIFDEYGLVVCGWSGVSDTALRDAMKRARSRRYATYWVSRGKPDEESRQLAKSLDGVVVRSEGADRFFEILEEKVAALESLQEGDPLTPAMAVATVKRYLEEDRYRIRLRDFLVWQASELRDAVFSRDDFPITWDGSPKEELPGKVQRRLRSYDVLLGPALGALVAGAYWAGDEQIPPFTELFRAVASPPHNYSQFFEVWQDLDLYPALRLFYGVGIASALAQNWGLLRILAREVTVEDPHDYRPRPAAFVLDGGYLARNLRWVNHASLVYPDQTYYLPLTEYLYRTLEEPLREYVSDPASYNRAFEEFEVLLSLMSMNVSPASSPESAEAPRGRFVYDRRLGGGD
ncbi:MAG: SIR2 family protein, partial [Actinomycetota bacterium]|nr:SIR2 family protein [Actinomycetota bacterium]